MITRHQTNIHLSTYRDRDAIIGAYTRDGVTWVNINQGIAIFYDDIDDLRSFLAAIDAVAEAHRVEQLEL